MFYGELPIKQQRGSTQLWGVRPLPCCSRDFGLSLELTITVQRNLSRGTRREGGASDRAVLPRALGRRAAPQRAGGWAVFGRHRRAAGRGWLSLQDRSSLYLRVRGFWPVPR